MSLDFCAIDFETANPQRGSVCAVGVVRVHNGAIVDHLGGFIQPPKPHAWFGDYQTKVHHITPAHIRGAPSWEKALAAIERFVGSDLLVAHNAPFEASVFTQACAAEGIAVPPFGMVCTLAVAKKVYPHMTSRTLPLLAAALGVRMGPHHEAAADARAAADVLVGMAQKVGCGTVGDVIARTAVSIRPVGTFAA